MRKTQTGSCHCGKVAFEVEGSPDNATACNCSLCRGPARCCGSFRAAHCA